MSDIDQEYGDECIHRFIVKEITNQTQNEHETNNVAIPLPVGIPKVPRTAPVIKVTASIWNNDQ